MAFNHYAKIKRILNGQPGDWYVKRIDKPTSAKNFRGEVVHYDHYYRICDESGKAIKYCKFQKIDTFAKTLGVSVEDLVIIE